MRHRVVEQRAPRAHVAGVDVRLRGAAGPHLLADVERAHPLAHQPRHVLGGQAAAGHQLGGDRRVGLGGGEQVVVADRHAARRPGRPHVHQPRQGEQPAPGAARVEAGVDGSGERPRHLGQAVGQGRARLDVDLEVGVEEPERHALRAAREVVLGQADQPFELAAGRRPGVVEPQQHEHRDVGLAAHRRDQAGLRRERAGRARRRDVEPVGPALGGAGYVARMGHDHLEQRRAPNHVLTVGARGWGRRGRSWQRRR